jgi:NAD(P)-dependent dehydrogenase (short-subunit alcohol dehydrogenase family)
MKAFDLTGKVAIVTGSSKGIGKSIATHLAEAGARVVISSRKLPACEAVASGLNARYGDKRAIAMAANISSKEALKALVEGTVAAFGRLDIVVCNAASNPYYGPMDGISDEQFRKVLENNILSNHWLITFARPEIIRQGGGSIIIVSSTGALRGSPVLGAYCISKIADIQLARNLAVELGPKNVRVNCIVPGLVKTDFARALWEDEASLAEYLKVTPLKRIGEPDDIGPAAVFLASDAGRFMTGETMVIDGGATIHE